MHRAYVERPGCFSHCNALIEAFNHASKSQAQSGELRDRQTGTSGQLAWGTQEQ